MPISHAFTVCIHTENQNQVSFYPFILHEMSVLTLKNLFFLEKMYCKNDLRIEFYQID